MDQVTDVLWSQKYRPRKVADAILPAETKAKFQQMVDSGDVQNLLLSGKPGTGKTTVARAMLDEVDYDYIFINGSLENGIDVLRTKISNFASSVSFKGGRKFVIIDEADYLNCLDENEEVLLSNGDKILLKDMVEGQEYDVISFNMDTHEFESDVGIKMFTVEKEIYEIQLESGETIRVTDDHPLIVKNGVTGEIEVRSIADGLENYEIVMK